MDEGNGEKQVKATDELGLFQSLTRSRRHTCRCGSLYKHTIPMPKAST